jgi:hypothetical protein
MPEANQQQDNNTTPAKKERSGIWRWIVDNRWLVTITSITVLAVCIWGGWQYAICLDVAHLQKTPDASQAQQAAPVTDAEKRKLAADVAKKTHCVDPDTGGVNLAKLSIPLKIVLIVVSVLIGWFLDVFTGSADPRKIDHMVAFCYVFPFAMIAGILVPLFAYPVVLPEPPKPVGIILGCNERPTFPLDKDLVPDGIRCFNRADQYLVNIGGNAELLTDEVRRQREDELQASARAVHGAERPAGDRSPPPTAGNAGRENPNADKPVAVAPGPIPAAGTPGAQPIAAEVEPFRQRYVITGGLVVPLYFVIIAIFGGFVSMLRRVPEYQERVSSNASDRLTIEKAREKLVFEVLQLLAAPIIAITAYYLVDPASRASSIALAFVAGFSSETVLMYIRALAEKVQPPTARTSPDVEVSPTVLDFGQQAVTSPSAAQTVRVTNRTGSVLSGTVIVSGEFACTPVSFDIASGQVGSFDVTFIPMSVGKKSGTLQIKDNAPGAPRTVELSGEGTAGAG